VRSRTHRNRNSYKLDMDRYRWLAALVAFVGLGACSTAPRPDRPVPPPVVVEEDEGSAALEEAGLEGDIVDEDAPRIDVEEEADDLPGQFLYPPGGELPGAIQRQVEQFVHAFTEGRARETYGRWLDREAVWGDWIREQLRDADLPEDLVYLAMIESGFHPTIVSHAGATGMWQFMPATARLSGLRVDDWVDERRDPEAATRAAIRHLTELYATTSDWALTAAAYNAGLGRVTRARAGRDERDYFSLSLANRLPRETRNYVPIMLAAAWVDRHRADYGLPAREPAERPATDTLTVEGRVRLSVLADGLGTSGDTLKALNPHLVRGAVPPTGGPVRVPAGIDTIGLGGRLASLPMEERLLPDWMVTRYTVRSGDSWWAIARRHGTSVNRLRALNPRGRDIIHPGDRLVVRRVAAYDTGERVIAGATTAGPAGRTGPASPPRSSGRSASSSTAGPADGAAEYTVRSGDTMTGIARRLGVSVATLAEWNDMSEPRPLRTGETLRVAAPVIRYTVQPGDTMTGLAQRYRVSVDDLAAWNRMARPRPLRIGETLVVRTGS
jgi:membrane-bound lytic murein transglycosylase D